MLKLYGHPFSSYTWKALIPFYANRLEFDFRKVGGVNADDDAFVQAASPQGKFPVLVDGDTTVFEATSIIEHLALHQLAGAGLLPSDRDAAVEFRKMDRVFDNYVMNVMQRTVDEFIRHPEEPDQGILSDVRQRLERSYAWIDEWLAGYRQPDQISLIECAAAPSLFYSDWVHPIPDSAPRLRAWRQHLLALPPVSRCVEDARPFRSYFPPGAPDRD